MRPRQRSVLPIHVPSKAAAIVTGAMSSRQHRPEEDA